MMYLTLRIRSATNDVLFEKDIDVRTVFEDFVRTLISDLVKDGTLQTGEAYTAVVIPRYERYLNPRPLLLIDLEKTSATRQWITMRFEEKAKPDQPVRFFTVEVHARDSGLVYRQDIHTSELDRRFIAFRIGQALIRLGVLRTGDYYHFLFFARDDGVANFDREILPTLERSAASLVELTSEEPSEPTFEFRRLDFYGDAETAGEPSPKDVRVCIRRGTLEDVIREGRLSTHKERGGILVGDVFRSPDGGPYLVAIDDLIVSEDTVSSIYELRYTFKSWLGHSTMMREKFPGRRIVGWYHTHLVEMPVHVQGERETRHTTMFFSRDDVFLHRKFFPEEWYVALVVDTYGNTIFFQWQNREIAPCAGYRIYKDGTVDRAGAPKERGTA